MPGHPMSSRRIRRPACVPVVALLAAGTLTLAGCVSNARYTEVEQQRDLLAARLQALQNEADGATRDREVLAKEKVLLGQEKTTLTTQKTALEERVSQMQTQQDELGSKLREREEESQKLQATYDGLVANLKKELKAGQVQVQQLRDGLRVNVAQDILFDSGSAEIDQNGNDV